MLPSWSPMALVAWSQLFSPVVPAQIPLLPQSHTEGYKFDALLHLPGISPYFDAVGSGLDHTAPRHCEVTAAAMLRFMQMMMITNDSSSRFWKSSIPHIIPCPAREGKDGKGRCPSLTNGRIPLMTPTINWNKSHHKESRTAKKSASTCFRDIPS